MFDSIASKYDLLNDVLSFGLHRKWKQKAVKITAENAEYVLDVASGTGDMTVELLKIAGGRAVSFDFSEKMLAEAKKRYSKLGIEPEIIHGDAMAMPFNDGVFDSACIAFGIRNIDSPERCLTEMARVVKPGGRVVVLEFGQPRGTFGLIYRFYSKFVIPLIGNLIAGNRTAYSYLQDSSERFPCGPRFEALMHRTMAYSNIVTLKLSYGIAYIYVGTK